MPFAPPDLIGQLPPGITARPPAKRSTTAQPDAAMPRFEHRARYSAPADLLFTLYANPDFQARKARALGASRVRVDSGNDASGPWIELEVHKSAPGAWAGLLDASTLHIRLDPSTRSATWTRTQHGFEDRSSASGRSRVIPLAANRCEVVLEGELTLEVPTLARMVEKLVLSAIAREHRREVEFLRAELARRTKAA
ncbi:MAG: DUF2505 family protein [Deltaproteobacteria bacterium]|nr:DUF2505 family protein [Deltaproteobacteria bacterium]